MEKWYQLGYLSHPPSLLPVAVVPCFNSTTAIYTHQPSTNCCNNKKQFKETEWRGSAMLGKLWRMRPTGALQEYTTRKRRHSWRRGPSITAPHLFRRTRLSVCFLPRWTDGFCRLGGHGTAPASKRIWQRRTNSLTKAASTTHLQAAWHTHTHTPICTSVCVSPVDENMGDKFSSAAQVLVSGPTPGSVPREGTADDSTLCGCWYWDVFCLGKQRRH